MDSVTHALFQLPYEIIHAAQHEGRDIDVTMRLESLDNITLAAKNRDNGANRETDFRMFTECAGLQLAFNGGPLTFTFHQANNANTTLSMKTREHMVARAWTELRNIVNRGENPERRCRSRRSCPGFCARFRRTGESIGTRHLRGATANSERSHEPELQLSAAPLGAGRGALAG